MPNALITDDCTSGANASKGTPHALASRSTWPSSATRWFDATTAAAWYCSRWLSGSSNGRSPIVRANSSVCGSPATAAHEPCSRSSPIAAVGNDCNGCSAPTRTSGRRAWRSANASRPREPARCSTSAPGSSDGATVRVAASIARSGVATITTTAAPIPASDTSEGREQARHRRGGRSRVRRAARDRNDLPTVLDERQRDRRTGASGAHECESLVSRGLRCFHVRSVTGTRRVKRPVEPLRVPPPRARLPTSRSRRRGRARRHGAVPARIRVPTCADAEWSGLRCRRPTRRPARCRHRASVDPNALCVHEPRAPRLADSGREARTGRGRSRSRRPR